MSPEDDEGGGCRVSCRCWIASELASTEACSDLREAARAFKVVWRALGSLMAVVRRWVGGAEEGRDGGGGDGGRLGEEGLERDTRLSRALVPRIGGPQLRSVGLRLREAEGD